MCFDNYIGLRGACEDSTPISGMYINDLAGISLKTIANLSTEKSASFKEVWESIYRRSVNEMQSDIFIMMQEFIKTNILYENAIVGRLCNPPVAEIASNHYKGIAISVNESKNTEIFINDVQLYLDSAEDSEIRIYNYNDGALLDTISFNGIQGLNTIYINKRYTIYGQRKKIFVCYDGNIPSIQSKAVYIDTDCGYATICGAKIDIGTQVIEDNLDFDAEGHGLIINFNIVCSVDNFICSIRDLLKMALLYKLGENVMLERLTSDRINQYTMVNMEQAEKLQEEYRTKYRDNVNATLNNIEPHGDTCCFPCNKKRTYKYLIP